MKRNLLIIMVLLATVSCRLEDEVRTGPLHIVTTTGIIADVTKQIVGDSADVSSLMGPGVDPHLYKPTPADIDLLNEADVIITNGLHLEGKMAELLDKLGKEKPVLKVSDGIAKNKLIKSSDFEDSYDPHIWFDPILWAEGFNYITKKLCEIDSNSTEYYQKNYESFNREIVNIDAWIQSEFKQLNDSTKVLITSHDAFSYFGRRYQIEVRGIQGISTLSEVGLKDLADLVDFVIARKIRSIFVETSTSDKTAQSIVDGAKDKGYVVQLDGPLYSDALGEAGEPAGSYFGMLRVNVEKIKNGLK
jgi:manganese/zinc/iron transport system substrate-binding protein